MKSCIFIVTFPRDYQLAQWGVRSLRKYLAGDYRIHVNYPEGAPRPPVDADEFSTVSEPPGKGFLAHMIVQCQPDLYAPGYDRYLHWDSDCMICCPTHINDFGQARPIVYYEPYANMIAHCPTMLQWQASVARCLGFVPEHEFMRAFPIIYPAPVYPATRQRVSQVVNKPFDQYVFSCRNTFPQTFCEFNTLGAWAWERFRDDIDFRRGGYGPDWWGDRVYAFWGPGGPDFRGCRWHGNHLVQGKTPREAAAALGLL